MTYTPENSYDYQKIFKNCSKSKGTFIKPSTEIVTKIDVHKKLLLKNKSNNCHAVTGTKVIVNNISQNSETWKDTL